MEHSNNVACIFLKNTFESFSNTFSVNLVDCLKIPWYGQDSIAFQLFDQLLFKNFWLTLLNKKQFQKEFLDEVKGFWIWFIANHFQCNISSLGTFDLYVILTQFVSKINQALTTLSFDSALTSIVDKQPLWLSIFCCLKLHIVKFVWIFLGGSLPLWNWLGWANST